MAARRGDRRRAWLLSCLPRIEAFLGTTAMRPLRLALLGLAATLPVVGSGPASAQTPKAAAPPRSGPKPIPGPGIAVPDADRQALTAALGTLDAAVADLRAKKDGKVDALLPDILIYSRAVRSALDHDEFYHPREIAKAMRLLEIGQRRANQLRDGQSPWTSLTGLVARGYVSKIDGSIQPYGLVVPSSYTPITAGRYRLDIWFHGRGEQLTEVNFLDERERQVGQFAPSDTIVLHPYGRFCNAFKFAGEVDVLEGLADVQNRYRVDPDRISVRGFSMGGAAAWTFGTHYADRWFACNPGAGFAESARFLKLDPNSVPWYQRALFHLYDSTDYALNLAMCPTVAYSGAQDGQKQAADVMDEALQKEGLRLLHVLGPDTKHAYHPEAAKEVERRLASLADSDRQRFPWTVRLTTSTLKYNQMGWVRIDALNEHWRRTTVRTDVAADGSLIVTTENVAALTFDSPPGRCGIDLLTDVRLKIDDQNLPLPRPRLDRSWHVELIRDGQTWRLRPDLATASTDYSPLGPLPPTFKLQSQEAPRDLRKRHDLQGPIDDAFMGRFLMVRPTGTSPHQAPAAWVASEMPRALARWRTVFRGDAPVVDDSALTDEQISSSNLVLWGDPASNAVIRRIADKLPIRWEGGNVVVGDRKFPAETHAPILIYPNPLNPSKYVVLNSGFTFREEADANNARQIPMLPDWAVVDVTTPPDAKFPGRIADADFFDEGWHLKPPHVNAPPAPEAAKP